MKLLIYFTAFILSACGGGASQMDMGDYAPAEMDEMMASEGISEMEASMSRKSTTLVDNTSPVVERKLIQTRDISFQVEDFDQTRAFVESTIKKYDAYIAHANQSNDRYRLNQQMQIRVKAGEMDRLISDLMSQSIFTHFDNVNVRDVTEEFVDLEIRLENKRAVELQYREILKMAKSIKDILEVERQLAQIREEIESKEGRLKYLSSQVEYHTINLNFYQELEYQGNAPERSFFGKAWSSLVAGWNLLEDLVLGIIAIWPLWLVALPIGIWIVRKLRRRKK